MNWDTYITDLDIPDNWEDTSYHHDELPSYAINGYRIWVDSHDVEERKINSKRIMGYNDKLMPRFTIMDDKDDPDNYETTYMIQVAPITLLETNDFDEVKRFVKDDYTFFNLMQNYETYCKDNNLKIIDANEYVKNPSKINDQQEQFTKWLSDNFKLKWESES
tara:strand:- start:894 stop:1382 length:489 start_codon:yes stop_codon:yes gene_type:complete